MTLPKYAPLSLPNFEKNSKFDDMYMCILLKFEYAKFRVSNLFFQTLLKKNLWGGRPVKEELKEMNAERIFRTRFNNTIKYPWKRQLRKVYVLFVATKVGPKLEQLSFFQGNQGNCSNFAMQG